MSDFYQGGNRNKGGDRGGKFGGGGFKKFGGGGGFKKFGGDRGGFGGERREVTMHRATCGECGNSCEVPFKPSQDKPVFCNDCFMSRRNERDAGQTRGEGRGNREGGFERREERGSRERYISTPRTENKFESKGFDNSKNEKNISEMRAQISELTQKIENLVSIVSAAKTNKEVVKIEKVEKVEKAGKPEKVSKVVAKKVATKKVK